MGKRSPDRPEKIARVLDWQNSLESTVINLPGLFFFSELADREKEDAAERKKVLKASEVYSSDDNSDDNEPCEITRLFCAYSRCCEICSGQPLADGHKDDAFVTCLWQMVTRMMRL